MKIIFKEPFAKDLKSIKNKGSLSKAGKLLKLLKN